MSRFLAEHERGVIKVEASNRRVDLVGDAFDMTIRGHVGPLQVLAQRSRAASGFCRERVAKKRLRRFAPAGKGL